MRPIWSIAADGADITDKLQHCLISLSVTDKIGMEADELEVTVADPLGEIAIPPLGAQLAVSLGYEQTGLVEFGTFVADNMDVSSPPRVLTIHAHSADITGDLKTRTTKSWEDTTISTIVGDIADKHGLQTAVGIYLQDKPIKKFDQTNESDIAFLTRLGEMHDAIVTIKDGRVVFTPHAQGTSASGTDMGSVTLTQADVTTWHVHITSQDIPTTVEARYYDKQTATEEIVQAKRPTKVPANYAGAFSQAEKDNGIPQGRLEAIGHTESRFNPLAVSPAGAKGIMQFMPGTAADYKLADPFNPIASIAAAGRYLKDLYDLFGNWDIATQAYNCGQGTMQKHLAPGGPPLPAETRAYLPLVQKSEKSLDTGDGPTLRLRQTFTDHDLAVAATESKASAFTRSTGTLSLTLPGRTDILSETPIELSGFAEELDGRWIVTQATHRLDSGGYVTEVEGERPEAT